MIDTQKPVLRDIYAYTTQSDCIAARVKIGETVKQTIDKRIKQQDGSSSSEELVKVGEILQVPYTDGQVRKEIERLRLGYPHRKEWMTIPGGIDTVMRAIQTALNSLQWGIERANSYTLLPWQQACHDKAVEAFEAGFPQFLMGTVMRFGKTFTSLQIARTLGAENILIITGKPEVCDSWKNELNQHVDFADWQFMDLRDKNLALADIDFTKKNLFFVSFQYLLADAAAIDKSWISNLSIDLLLTDEEHYASKTDKSRDILDDFGSVRTIAMSGTPIESRLSGRYVEENSFYWSYRDAAVNNPLMPELKIFSMSVAQELAQQAASGGFIEENAFHINKMFAAENGKFVYESDVRAWVEKVFDLAPMSRKRRVDSPECIPSLNSTNFNHILIRVPYSVDAGVALCDLLTEMLPDRKIILASGSGNGAITKIAQLKRIISQNDKTITVTCGRFETGVTVPEWGAVYLCDGGKSPESYWQMIFRASTPCNTGAWKKREFYVFDMDPHRSLEMMHTAAAVDRSSGQPLEDSILQWLDVAPILQHDGSQFVEIDAQGVLKAFDNTTAGNMLERYASEFGIHNIYDEAALDILADISVSSKRKLIQAIANNPDLEKGKIKKIIEKSISSKERAEIRQLKEKLKSVLRRIPMTLPKLGAVDLRSLLNTDESSYFYDTVGISLEGYKSLIDNGVIDRGWQDECIVSTANYLLRIGHDKDSLWKILGLYASMGTEVSPGTPRELANEILDTVPEELWADRTRTFCNPNVSDGTFYFLIVERLMQGLENIIVDPLDRLRHILTEQVFGFDHKPGPLGFVQSIAERYYDTKALGIELNLTYKNILEEN